MKNYISHVFLLLLTIAFLRAAESSHIGAVLSDPNYAKEIQFNGAVLTDEDFRSFAGKGSNAELVSSTFAQLSRAPLEKPNYLVLRFNHPRKQHLSGDVLATINMGSGKPFVFPIELHIGDYWRTYYIPLDSLSWPEYRSDPVKVSITWRRLTLQ